MPQTGSASPLTKARTSFTRLRPYLPADVFFARSSTRGRQHDVRPRRVSIIQSVLKQYRVPFYTRLAARLKADGIEPCGRKNGGRVMCASAMFIQS